MNVVEFIKSFGWETALKTLSRGEVLKSSYFDTVKNEFFCGTPFREGIDVKRVDFISELKPYLDAHLLVEDNGGLEEAKEFLKFAPVGHPDVLELSDAVNLVEEVENDR